MNYNFGGGGGLGGASAGGFQSGGFQQKQQVILLSQQFYASVHVLSVLLLVLTIYLNLFLEATCLWSSDVSILFR